MNDFESLSENSHGDLLLTVLSVVSNHKLVHEPFGNWALNLLESLLLIFSSGVWHIDLGFDALDVEVVGQGLLRAINTVIGPFSKKHWLNSKAATFYLSYIKRYTVSVKLK